MGIESRGPEGLPWAAAGCIWKGEGGKEPRSKSLCYEKTSKDDERLQGVTRGQ